VKASTLLAIAVIAYWLYPKTAKAAPGAAPGATGPLPAPPRPRAPAGAKPAARPESKVPAGYLGKGHDFGLHKEPGTLFWYPNGDEWFVPDDGTLAPYHIPGGSTELPHP
jgi:hypothetical protein